MKALKKDGPDPLAQPRYGGADAHRAVVQSWLDQRAEPIRRALIRLSPAERRVFCEALQLLAEEFTTTAEQ